MPSISGSIAGVRTSQALLGFLITAPPSVCIPDVIGALVVWIQNQKKKIENERRYIIAEILLLEFGVPPLGLQQACQPTLQVNHHPHTSHSALSDRHTHMSTFVSPRSHPQNLEYSTNDPPITDPFIHSNYTLLLISCFDLFSCSATVYCDPFSAPVPSYD